MRYQADAFGGHSRDEFVRAMQAEGIGPCGPGYTVSLVEMPAVRQAITARFGDTALPDIAHYPVTRRASTEGLWLTQYVFMGDRSDMDSIVEAMRKIQRAWQ
jgi:dTDP-4-amino-4,6-dideoxygalactose transaminase